MLDLILGLLNDLEYRDREVTQIVCPVVEQTTLADVRLALQSEAEFDVSYRVSDGYQILSVERQGRVPLYTDELRVLVSTMDGSCKALVFRKTL